MRHEPRNWSGPGTAELRKEWLEIMAGMWTMFGKPVDDQRLVKYADHLGYIPLGLLREVVDVAVSRQEFNIPPTIFAVIQALKSVLGYPADVMDAIRLWEDRRFSRCGWVSVARFKNPAARNEWDRLTEEANRIQSS